MKRLIPRLLLSAAMVGVGSIANANCESQVDEVEFFYVNGMSNDAKDFLANRIALQEFIRANLPNLRTSGEVYGTHNKNENAIEQLIEVAGQKYGDWNARQKAAVHEFILGGGEFTKDAEGMAAVEQFLKDIGASYYSQIGEEDALLARESLRVLLDTCSRVVMVTHSQGNFYGNMLMNWAYSTYQYPNGFRLSKYPMLGIVQLASPVYMPGGSVSEIYPDIVGHVTLSNDLVMKLVRSTVGAVEASMSPPTNPNDFSGHSMVISYLKQPDVANTITGSTRAVIGSMIPYPMHGQRSTGSAAFAGIGYSAMSEFLDLHFATGGVYRYSGVAPSTFGSFWEASSQGAHFNENIRDAYSYERIEEK